MDHSHRIAFHQRAQHDVLRKIEKLYPQIAAPLTLSKRQEKVFDHNFQRQLHSRNKARNIEDTWVEAKESAATNSGLALNSIDKELDALAESFGRRLGAAGCMHKQMERHRVSPAIEIYEPESTDHRLAFVYKNHLCLELDAQLQKLGIEEKSAYLLTGQIVHGSVTAGVSTFTFDANMHVRPYRDASGKKNTTDAILRDRDNMENYRHDSRKLLQLRLRMANGSSGIER